MLMAADEGHIVNTSSINGLFASVGPNRPHTAYSAAKFAVRGFSEALITDLAMNAPHVRVSVVMPGHVGTSIIINSGIVHGKEPDTIDEEELVEGATSTRGQTVRRSTRSPTRTCERASRCSARRFAISRHSVPPRPRR